MWFGWPKCPFRISRKPKAVSEFSILRGNNRPGNIQDICTWTAQAGTRVHRWGIAAIQAKKKIEVEITKVIHSDIAKDIDVKVNVKVIKPEPKENPNRIRGKEIPNIKNIIAIMTSRLIVDTYFHDFLQNELL